MKATPDPEILRNTDRPPKRWDPIENDRRPPSECGEPVEPRSDPPTEPDQPNQVVKLSEPTLLTQAAWQQRRRKSKITPLHEMIAQHDFSGATIGG